MVKRSKPDSTTEGHESLTSGAAKRKLKRTGQVEPARVQWRRFTSFQRQTSPNHTKLLGTTSLHKGKTHTNTYRLTPQHDLIELPGTRSLHQAYNTHTDNPLAESVAPQLSCIIQHISKTESQAPPPYIWQDTHAYKKKVTPWYNPLTPKTHHLTTETGQGTCSGGLQKRF